MKAVSGVKTVLSNCSPPPEVTSLEISTGKCDKGSFNNILFVSNLLLIRINFQTNSIFSFIIIISIRFFICSYFLQNNEDCPRGEGGAPYVASFIKWQSSLQIAGKMAAMF